MHKEPVIKTVTHSSPSSIDVTFCTDPSEYVDALMDGNQDLDDYQTAIEILEDRVIHGIFGNTTPKGLSVFWLDSSTLQMGWQDD